MRKMFNFWRVCVILSASLFSLQSCLDVDDNDGNLVIDPVEPPNVLVTVKPVGENSCPNSPILSPVSSNNSVGKGPLPTRVQ